METQSAEQVTGWVASLLKVVEMLSTPPGVGLIVNLTMVQVLEAWDHLLPEKMHRPGTSDISKPMAITLSVPISIVLTMAFCGFNRNSAVLGLIGGIGGIIVSALLDKIGFNLDRLAGNEGK